MLPFRRLASGRSRGAAWSVHHSAVDSAAVHSANARRKRTRGLRTASEGHHRTPLAARLRGAALLHEQLQA